MKTKQRGVATGVMVAIVIIVVAVVAVVAILLLRGEGGPGAGPGGLSTYPGSQGWDIPEMYKAELPEGVEVEGYTVSGVSVEDILNWYKGQMTGWTLEHEVPVMSIGGVTMGGLIYRKGDDGSYIWAAGGTGLPGTVYMVATGPWSAWEEGVP